MLDVNVIKTFMSINKTKDDAPLAAKFVNFV